MLNVSCLKKSANLLLLSLLLLPHETPIALLDMQAEEAQKVAEKAGQAASWRLALLVKTNAEAAKKQDLAAGRSSMTLCMLLSLCHGDMMLWLLHAI